MDPYNKYTIPEVGEEESAPASRFITCHHSIVREIIEDVMEALAISEFEGFENYETVAGFLMYTLRKVPRRTDTVEYAGFKFEVVDIDQHRIDQVLVTRADATPAG